ncbi:polysaccharide biosynthesis C-terminal domain-containing protein [Bradyrhizobium sp. LHD-71]|uniref:lipopolysaccharide biosynthesis protein n=1 Tax=Bradyrhizobium sp. LHD-71 TaxID=3072141 RepID=UPI00280D8D45|nr:polysaccharide biosynthesis C-terminal domain-containing protein [Bradyrhizobium sp. LHD-71]MDQ8726667.1 polysaccharide biosynthesis C-terminal domain-containing protein [Bradyrhizobium sp. LHD-71]
MPVPLRRLRYVTEPLMRRLGGEIVHAFSGTIVVQLGAGLVAFLMLSLAARAMPAAEFGHLATWLSITQMGSVCALLGQEMFILRALNEYTVSNSPELARGALNFSLQIVATLPLLLAAAMFLVGHFVLKESAALMLGASLYLIANSVVGFGGHVARYAVGLLLAEGTREIFWKTLTTAALFVIVRGKATIDPAEFFLIACVALAVAITTQVTVTVRAFPQNIWKARPIKHSGAWWRASTRLWLTTVLETLNQYFDVIVIYLLLDAPAAGVYFVASRIANSFGTLLSAAHVLAIRRIPQLYFAGRIDEINRVFSSMAEIILLCVTGGILLIVFGADAILGFFGPSFAGQQWALIILVAGTALAAAGGPAPAVLLISGHEGQYPWILVANIALRMLGFAILIPIFGLMGAALAATLSLLATTLTLNVLCRRWTGIDPSIIGIFRKVRPQLASSLEADPDAERDTQRVQP